MDLNQDRGGDLLSPLFWSLFLSRSWLSSVGIHHNFLGVVSNRGGGVSKTVLQGRVF